MHRMRLLPNAESLESACSEAPVKTSKTLASRLLGRVQPGHESTPHCEGSRQLTITEMIHAHQVYGLEEGTEPLT
jgi:hypothetical protein